MARKSRWAQFTDNFNGVYGTFNQVGKDMASGKVMREEYTDEQGNALSGDALDRKRTMELAKVYTKYGDAKGGLALRSQQAQIEASKRENDINQQIMQELIRQRGGLTSSKMESDIAGTDANTGNTTSTTARRDALLPGEIEQQGATLAGTNANTGNTTSTTARRDALLPGEIEQQGATLAGTNANTGNTTSTTARRDALLPGEIENQGLTNTGLGLANQDAALDVKIKDETSSSTIESTNEGNDAKTADSKFKNLTSTLALEDLTREESLLTSIMGDDSYNTPEEAQTAYRAAIENDDTIPFERKNQILGAIDKMGLEKLTAESAKLAKGAQSALQTGGMDGLVKYYDTIDDGDTMRIERNDDGTVSIIATRGDEETVLFSDSSQDAETVVTQQMYNQISRPGTGMEVAAAALDMENTRSETSKNQSQVGLIDKQAFSELLAQDTTQARNALLTAQTDKVRAEIEQLGVGLQGAEKINLQGLANLQNSNEFVLLGQQKGGKQIQLSLVADYMRVMKMKDAPPNDVDPQDWFEATDEEKEALRN